MASLAGAPPRELLAGLLPVEWSYEAWRARTRGYAAHCVPFPVGPN
jgi:hypothetical protein